MDRVLALKGSREQAYKALKAAANEPERVAAIDAYRKAVEAAAQTKGLGNDEDLKHMLKGSGVLEFHILPSENDPELAATGGMAAWQQRLAEGPARARRPATSSAGSRSTTPTSSRPAASPITTAPTSWRPSAPRTRSTRTPASWP